jgi:hypothetical protein
LIDVSFLSPYAGLLAAGGLVPFGAFTVLVVRARRVRRMLGLSQPPLRRPLAVILALAGVALLLGLAATQPVVVDQRTRHVRNDAEAWLVFDTSRSMLASEAIGSPTRLQRAKALASKLRAQLGGVPVGIASLTDRTLPTLFPSPDPEVFAATLHDAIGIEQPPPLEFVTVATTLEPLDTVRTANFFAPSTTRRLLVIFTDGESRPFSYPTLGRLMRQPPRIRTIIVRLWHADEHVYSQGQMETAYKPDPSSRATVRRLAAATAGRAFDEDQLGAAVATARKDLGSGPAIALGESQGQTRLAPFMALGALLPLSLLLWRRNFG